MSNNIPINLESLCRVNVGFVGLVGQLYNHPEGGQDVFVLAESKNQPSEADLARRRLLWREGLIDRVDSNILDFFPIVLETDVVWLKQILNLVTLLMSCPYSVDKFPFFSVQMNYQVQSLIASHYTKTKSQIKFIKSLS